MRIIRLWVLFMRELLWPWFAIAFFVQLLGTSRGDGESIWISSLVMGLVIGAMHGTWETSQGTQDYTSHRGLSLAKQNWIGCTAVLAAMTLWFLWPPLLWDFVPDTRVELTTEAAIVNSTFCVGGFSVAMWASCLPISGAWRALVLAATLLPYLSIVSDLVDTDLWAVAGVHGVMFILSTLHSSRLMEHPYDADVPPRKGWLAPVAVVLVLATAIHPLSTFEERRWPDEGLAVELLTAVRSPVTSLIAEHTSIGVDPEHFHGDLSRLLFATPSVSLLWTFVVALVLALHVAVDLAGSKVHPLRRGAWVVAVLVFGFSAALARLMFDSRRRWRQRIAADEMHAPTPLLSSSRSTT